MNKRLVNYTKRIKILISNYLYRFDESFFIVFIFVSRKSKKMLICDTVFIKILLYSILTIASLNNSINVVRMLFSKCELPWYTAFLPILYFSSYQANGRTRLIPRISRVSSGYSFSRRRRASNGASKLPPLGDWKTFGNNEPTGFNRVRFEALRTVSKSDFD